jgi:hypothetical protein
MNARLQRVFWPCSTARVFQPATPASPRCSRPRPPAALLLVPEVVPRTPERPNHRGCRCPGSVLRFSLASSRCSRLDRLRGGRRCAQMVRQTRASSRLSWRPWRAGPPMSALSNGRCPPPNPPWAQTSSRKPTVSVASHRRLQQRVVSAGWRITTAECCALAATARRPLASRALRRATSPSHAL